nr:hypothetical protein [Tanacetum cinerariifolium]
MELESTQNSTTTKLPMLKLGDYEMRRLRIEKYFQIQDYDLWDIIENGNSFKLVAKTTTDDTGTSTTRIPYPVTIDEKAKKWNDVKARSMLLMAIPNEHLMTLNQYKDRNKSNLDTMSLNDLYNNIKIVEQEDKGTTSTNTSSQNMTFMSSPSPNSTNEVHTVFTRECRLLRNQENITSNQETTRRTLNVQDTSSKAIVAIDGAGFDWSYMADDEALTNRISFRYVSYNVVPPPHTGKFSPLRIDLSYTGLPEFVKPSVQSYRVKPIEVESDEEDEVESHPKKERKSVEPSMDKEEVEIPKQNEKPTRRPVLFPKGLDLLP